MAIDAYNFVGMYSHALATTRNILAKGAAHAAAAGVSQTEMLGWRLVEDMQPLSFQLMVVCNFACAWPARFAGEPVPKEITADLAVAGFHRAIDDAQAYLARLRPEDFAGKDDIELTHTLGTEMTVTLPRGRWLTTFATTNLYFHLSTAYGILRANGVPIGKADLFAGGL